MIRRSSNRKGFTLAEVLIVVGIIVILMAIAVPSVFVIQKNLRQTELDAKAETIYVAVQNKLSKMKAAGDTKALQVDAAGVAELSDKPSGYDGSSTDVLCYFTSATTTGVTAAVMEPDTVDGELAGYHWVVEYNPDSCTVYGVFYSENRENCASGYVSSWATYDSYRTKENRLNAGANVGYYGGGAAGAGSPLKEINPTLEIVNGETLKAIVSCTVPSGVGAPVFQIDIADKNGNVYTQYYDCTGNTAYDTSVVKIDHSGRSYTMTLTLDDLSSDVTRFVNLYGKDSSNATKLLSGTPITITVTAMVNGESTVNHTISDNHSDSAVTNSLFADSSTVDETKKNVTAMIACGRHLQNLDASSGVTDNSTYKVTAAQQISDIAFNDTDSEWYETYSKTGTTYFNGQNTAGAMFKPITNANLTAYNGALTETGAAGTKSTTQYTIAGLNVDTSTDTTKSGSAGLFGTLTGQTVKNVRLTGASVASTANAGALAGTVAGNTTLQNCQVYLTTDDIGEGTNKKDNTHIWISGTTAGGLVGAVSGGTVSIESCSASSVVGAYTISDGTVSFTTQTVGGLIGSAAGDSTNVTLTGSYADNYLVGTQAGGLVGAGSANLTVTKCYAAGFMTSTAAESDGLVHAYNSITDSYSIMVALDLQSGVTQKVTTAGVKADNRVYYMPTETQVNSLINAENSSFIAAPAKDDPQEPVLYYLLGQDPETYNAYTYPVLNTLRHYGDYGTASDYILTLKNKYEDGTTVDNTVWSATMSGEFSTIATLADSTDTTKTYKDLKLNRDGWVLKGWYETGADGNVTATEVLDAEGKVVASADGLNFNVTPTGTITLSQDETLVAVWGHTLTLEPNTNTNDTWTWSAVIAGTVSDINTAKAYKAPEAASGNALVGWYTAVNDGNPAAGAVKILNADGTLAKNSYSSGNITVTSSGLSLSDNVTLYAVWGHKLTLQNGTTETAAKNPYWSYGVSGSISNITDVASYTTPPASGSWTLDGWYASSTLTDGKPSDGTKVLKADGSVVAGVSGEGFTTVGGTLTLSKDVTLYACWKQGAIESADIYVLATAFTSGNDYIITSGNTEGDVTALYMSTDFNGNYTDVESTTLTVKNDGAYNTGTTPYIESTAQTLPSGVAWSQFVWTASGFTHDDIIKDTEFSADKSKDAGTYTGFYLINKWAKDTNNETWYLYNPLNYHEMGSVDKATNQRYNSRESLGGYSYETRMWRYIENGLVPCYGHDTGCWSLEAYFVNDVVKTATSTGKSTSTIKKPAGGTQVYIYEKKTKEVDNTEYTFDFYTVTYASNYPADSGMEPADSTVRVKAGSAIAEWPEAPTAPANSSYVFAGWTDVNGNDVTLPVTINSDTTFKAKWSDNTFTIIYDGNGGSYTEEGSEGEKTQYEQKVVCGVATALAENKFTRDNCTFAGWKDEDGNTYSAGDKVTDLAEAGESITLYAQWNCKVTFVDNDHGTSTTGQTLAVGSKVVKPTDPTTNGYTFYAWYKDKECTVPWDFETTVSGNTTLYAKWNPFSYTIIYDGNGSDTDMSGYSTPKTFGTPENLIKEIPVRTGYTFLGWSADKDATKATYVKDAENGPRIEDDLVKNNEEEVPLYAVWQINAYTITFDANGGAFSDSATSQLVTKNYGEKLTAPASAPTRGDCTFAGWYKEQTFENEWKFDTDTVTDNQTLYAKWIYTVTFDVHGHGTAPSSQTVVVGGTVTAPQEPSATGYTFGGWYTDEDYADAHKWDFINNTVTGNITLHAKWTANQYTVTFDANGGTTETTTKTCTYDSAYGTLPTAEYNNHKFLGWYTEATGGTQVTADTIFRAANNDTVLHAHWVDAYTVSFDINGHGTQWDPQVVAANDYADDPGEMSAGGYTFGGWYTDEDYAEAHKWNFSTNTVTRNITLHAKWTANQYTVTFKANGGTPATQTQQYTYNSAYETLPTPTYTNHKFLGWYTEATGGTQVTADTIFRAANNDTVLHAHWVDAYTVSFDINGHGTQWDPQVVAANDYADDPGEMSAGGYTFGGWYTDEDYADAHKWNFSENTVTGNITLHAKWTANQYTVTFDANGGTPETQVLQYTHGSAYGTLPTANYANHGFLGWFTEATGGTQVTADTVFNATDNNTKLYAHWVEIYTVSFDINEHGTQPNSQPVAANGKADNPGDLSEDGYTFGGWYTDEDYADAHKWNFSTNTVTGNITLHAKWTANQYTVTFDANGGTPETQVLQYTHGSAYGTLPTANYANHGFLGWFTEATGGTQVTADTVFNATDNNTKLYAHWVVVYTVTFNNHGHGVAHDNEEVVSGNLVTDPNESSVEGYKFIGWYTDEDYADAHKWNFSENTVTENITLHAKWEAEYTLHLIGTGKSGTGDQTYTITSSLTSLESLEGYSNPEKSDWTFDGWCSSRGGSQIINADKAVNVTDITSLADDTNTVTLYARWTRTAYVQTTENGNGYLMGALASSGKSYLIYGTKTDTNASSDSTVSVSAGTYATTSNNSSSESVFLINSIISNYYKWNLDNGVITNVGLNQRLGRNLSGTTNYAYLGGTNVTWTIKTDKITCTIWGFSCAIDPIKLKLDSVVAGQENCYLYKETPIYAWSGYSDPATKTTIVVNSAAYAETPALTTDAIAPTQDGASAEIETTASSAYTAAPDTSYALTLQNGSSVLTSVTLPNGSTSLPGYTAPTRTDPAWTLDGWYTSADGTGVKILNADGTIAAADADGYTAGGALALADNTTLYARWSRLTSAYMRTDTLEPGQSYLITAVPDEENIASQIAFGRAASDMGAYTQTLWVSDPQQTAGEYSLYDETTGETAAITADYITDVTGDLVWYCADDPEDYGALYSQGGALALGGSGEGSYFTWYKDDSTDGWSYNTDTWTLQALNASGETENISFYKDDDTAYFSVDEACYQYILLYKRVTVRQVSFADETMSLTLSVETAGVTCSVKAADGLWPDWTGYEAPTWDGYKFLGWYDSTADDANRVLDENGMFADSNVDGYILDGRWIGGSNVTLYAKWEPLPPDEGAVPAQDVTAEAQPAAEETAEAAPAGEAPAEPAVEYQAEETPETYAEEESVPAEESSDESGEEIAS